MATDVTGYFSWSKFPGNRIFRHKEHIKLYLGDRWDSLNAVEQDELLDDLFVDTGVRQQYETEASASDWDFPPSFPKLMIPNGEKIMVDENDLRTWRDAHSGPFSWKSKSQQDLTLLDFEPENISKPPVKAKKSKSTNSESENEDSKEATAPPQFVFSEDRWTDAMISEFRTYLDTVSSKPASRPSSPLEADNPAFEGSVQDVRGNSSQIVSECSVSEAGHSERSASMVSDSPAHSSTPDHSEKVRRSLSPVKKVIFTKTVEADTDTTEQLIKQEEEEAKNAFSNPAMASEWSTFVGQPNEETVEVPVVPVTSEPAVMTMDRGMESSDHSVESTPDHTAKLLPGQPDLHEAEQEEVIFVAVENAEDQDTSAFRKSGFDFLDDW